MSSQNLFQQKRPSVSPEQIQQIKAWVIDALALASDSPISINQLQCHEPGCPPIETVIAVMTQPPQTLKIHAAASELTLELIQQAVQGHPAPHELGSSTP